MIPRPNLAGQSGFSVPSRKSEEISHEERRVSLDVPTGADGKKQEAVMVESVNPGEGEDFLDPPAEDAPKRRPAVLPVRRSMGVPSSSGERRLDVPSGLDSSSDSASKKPPISAADPVPKKGEGSQPLPVPGKRDTWNDSRYVQVHGIPPELMAAVRAQVPSAKSNPAALSVFLWSKLPSVQLPKEDEEKIRRYALSDEKPYFRNLLESLRMVTEKCDRMAKQIDGLQMALSYLIQDRLGNLSGESRDGKRFSTVDVVDMGVKLDADIEAYRNQKQRRSEHYKNSTEYRESHR